MSPAFVPLDGIRSHRFVPTRAGVHRHLQATPAPTSADDPAGGTEGTG